MTKITRWLYQWMKQPLVEIVGIILDGLAPSRFVRSWNAINKFWWHQPISVSLEAGRIYKVSDSTGEKIFLARRSRIERYHRGINRKLEELEKEYLLDKIEFKKHDVVIDCGANVGEVSLLLAKKFGCNVVCVEPDELEFECLQLNLFGFGARCIASPLWYKRENITFYSKNESGDSSLFEVENATPKCKESTTLSDVISGLDVPRIKLLKLEAEGAEPEILCGGLDKLHIIDFISADVGPERGFKQELTAMPVYSALINNGFELIEVSYPRLVFLFRNTKLMN